MPLRDYRSYLSDVIEACKKVTEYSQGYSLDDYEHDDLRRDAIERKLGIIGEAIVQARKHYPQISNDLSYVNEIVGLRNRLIHAYLHTENRTVWNIIKEFIPVLHQEASETLERLMPNEL